MVSVVAARAGTDRTATGVSVNLHRPGGGLTLDEAIARALEREPSLRAARAQIDVAQGARAQAELRPNPSVSFSQQKEPGGTDNQTRVELQWPLDLYRKTGRVAVADREIDAAHQATANQERTLSADVRLEYGEVVTAIRTLSVTEQLLSATSRQRALVTSRVEQGAAPPLDRDMLRVEEQKLEADRRLQAGVVERRLVELKRLLGMPAGRGAHAATITRGTRPRRRRRDDGRPRLARDDDASGRPRSSRPGCSVAEAQIDRAQREGRPDVSLFGMYMRMDAGFPQQGFSPTGSLERDQECLPLRVGRRDGHAADR